MCADVAANTMESVTKGPLMNTDYTAYRTHQLRETDLVRRLEQRRLYEAQAAREPSVRRPRVLLRLLRRTRVVPAP
jgi:hypothetical protein